MVKSKPGPLELLEEIKKRQVTDVGIKLCDELKNSITGLFEVLSTYRNEINAMDECLEKIEHITEGTHIGIIIRDVLDKLEKRMGSE